MQLSSIEYNVIMEAINNYRAELNSREHVGDLSDETWNATERLAAIDRVEMEIMRDNIPF